MINLQKYYSEVTEQEYDRIERRFKEIVENSTTEKFVNMIMLCIQDEEAIGDIIFTEEEIKQLKALIISILGKKGKRAFVYNLIKDVNAGRLEAGHSKSLINNTKNLFASGEHNYIQTIREDTDGVLQYRTLALPRMDSFSLVETDSIYIHILKMEDEWFWVSIQQHNRDTDGIPSFLYLSKYYKCDAFYGLKKCLENELKKRISEK